MESIAPEYMKSFSRESTSFLMDMSKLIEHAHNIGYAVVVHEMHAMHANLRFFEDGLEEASLESLRPLGVYWEALGPLNKWGGNFNGVRRPTFFERNP